MHSAGTSPGQAGVERELLPLWQMPARDSFHAERLQVSKKDEKGGKAGREPGKESSRIPNGEFDSVVHPQ